jgi:hypothetical protein
LLTVIEPLVTRALPPWSSGTVASPESIGNLLLHTLAQPARPAVPLVLPTEILVSETWQHL